MSYRQIYSFVNFPRTCTGVGLLGGIACLFADNGPQRFAANWTMWWLFLLSIALGALFLVAMEHLVGARWSVPFRRTAERVSWLLFPLALAGAVALLGVSSLYPWAGRGTNELLAQTRLYLNLPFFALRSALCFAAWLVCYRLLVAGSLRQDSGLAPDFARRAVRRSAAFLVVFGITVTITAVDWLMSLQPLWTSTIIGVYLFSEAAVGALAAVTLINLYLKRRGRLPGITGDHFYNLGALLFGMACFWAYIAFSQMMLIWYGNLPKETVFYINRIGGGWQVINILLPAVHFIIPVFALLSRPAKMNERRLCWVSLLLLFSVLLSFYWFVFPVLGRGILFGWPETAFILFFAGAGSILVRKALSLGPDMPERDPHLQEGLEFAL